MICKYSLCSNLSKIDIPEYLTTIGRYAFQWCESLTEVRFPGLFQTINEHAFFHCTGLTDVYFGGSLPSKYENGTELHIFDGCDNLKNIYCAPFSFFSNNGNIRDWNSTYNVVPYVKRQCGENVYYEITVDEKNVDVKFTGSGDMYEGLIENGYAYEANNNTTIIMSIDLDFARFSYNVNISFEEGITSINTGSSLGKGYDFFDASSLFSDINISSISIPSTIKSIGRAAFAGANFNTPVIWPSSVTEIKAGAFLDSYVNFIFKGDLQTGLLTFGGYCGGSITFEGKVDAVDCFNCKKKEFYEDSSENTPYYLGYSYVCRHLTIDFKHAVKDFDMNRFYCGTIKNLHVTNDLRLWHGGLSHIHVNNLIVGDNATVTGAPLGVSVDNIVVDKNNKSFDSRNNCNAIISSETNELILGSLKDINIPKGVTSLGNFAFCFTEQTNAIIPPSVKNMDYSYVFGKYEQIASGDPGPDYNSLGDRNFDLVYSNNIKHIYNYSVTPQTGGIPQHKVTVHVPVGCKSVYESSEYWKENTIIDDIELNISSSTLSLDKGASIVLSASVTPSILDQSIVWSSDNPGIAKVDENGKVTACTSGTTTITAYNDYGELSASCQVTVSTEDAQACATPSIEMADGTLNISCATKDAKYHVSTSNNLNDYFTDNSIPLAVTINVYASKEGYKDSETVTKTISFSGSTGNNCDVNGDGKVDILDVTYLVNTILKK